MQKQILLAVFIGALIGGSLVFWYHRGAETSMPGTAMDRAHDMTLPSHQEGHMAHMQHMLVTSEQAFIEHMIPHHQEAIDTAREVLERGGTTEEIRVLVNDIITAQTAEIAAMQTWYETWYGAAYQDTGVYEPMMRELENLSGAELDRVFLEDMILHHRGAIMMARSVQPYIEHTEIEDLTKNIVATQSDEMVQMRQMLQGL